MLNPLSTIRTSLYTASGNEEVVTAKSGVLTFGSVAPGEVSSTIAIILKAPDVDAITNIKIALVNTGNITFTDTSFGVTSNAGLDFNIIPTTYFQGVNTTSSSTNQYNVAIDNADIHTSKYVYLNIKLPRNDTLDPGTVRYRWYFDYAN